MPLIHANGVELHYHLQGKGTPIIFLHPPCIGSRVFTYLRNDLSEDHKTLLFDFRGHGRSGSSQSPITIPLLAEDICQLMDRLNIQQAYLCTYSLSSFVALQALLTYPERFLGGILLGGISEATGWITRTKIKAGLLAGRLRARELISLPLAWVHADNHETFRRIRGETRAGDIGKWNEYMKSALQFSVTGRLPEIRQPMLLLCGQRDEEFKGYRRVLQKGLTNFSATSIPGVGHTLPIYGAGPIGKVVRSWVNIQQQQQHPEQGIQQDDPAANKRLDERVELAGFPIERPEDEAQEPSYH